MPRELKSMPKTLLVILAFASTTDAAITDGWRIFELAPLRPGKYVWTDGGPDQRRQICVGGGSRGATLSWTHAEDAASLAAGLARGIGARVFTTDRVLFDAVAAAMCAAAWRAVRLE
jgi:hypothetical protein